ncbi:MAG: hypothetical protein ACK5N8_01095 [Alphaproteobacteria bacterium]
MVKNKEIKVKNKPLVEEKVERANSSSEQDIKTAKKKSHFFLKFFSALFLLVGFCTFIVFKNPIIKEYFFPDLAKNEKDLNLTVQVLQNNVLNMEEDFSILKRDLNSDVDNLRQKYDSLEKHNLNVISSKADNASILGVIQRLDTIEVRLNEVAKVSDNGALIATTTMLVKDAAERGSNYIYEMSVLRSLAENEPKLLPYIEILGSFDEKGIYSETYLANQFNKIYSFDALEKQKEKPTEEPTSFMDKFNKKFGKLITIKYKNTQEIEEVTLDDIFVLVQAQDFSRALFELERPQYQTFVESNENLRAWMQDVKSRQEFYDAISKITAYSLGVMKANQLKN